MTDDELSPDGGRGSRAGDAGGDRRARSSPASRERCRAGWSANVTPACSTRGAGRTPQAARAAALARARPTAGVAAAARVGAALAALLAIDPVRAAVDPARDRPDPLPGADRDPRRAGVPPVVRDPFDERAWPEDRYDLVPRTLGDLGDPELGPTAPGLGDGQGDGAAGPGRREGPLNRAVRGCPTGRILLRVPSRSPR